MEKFTHSVGMISSGRKQKELPVARFRRFIAFCSTPVSGLETQATGLKERDRDVAANDQDALISTAPIAKALASMTAVDCASWSGPCTTDRLTIHLLRIWKALAFSEP